MSLILIERLKGYRSSTFLCAAETDSTSRASDRSVPLNVYTVSVKISGKTPVVTSLICDGLAST